MNLQNQQKLIGFITILSGILALGCMITALVGVNYNFDALSDPMLILSEPGASAEAARWSMILDMFGYYLLLLPAVYFFKDWLKTRTPWSQLISFSGLAYILIGAIGASILAVIWPSIIIAYQTAPASEQLILKANFKLVNDLVYGGMWNLLEVLFAGTWWVMTGVVLYRHAYRAVGLLTLLTGLFCFADGLSGIMQSAALHEIALNGYLLFAIVWAIVTGTMLVKGRFSLGGQ